VRGLATRRRILECAVLRFADQGYRQTSVAQVARDAGLTPPAVHAHFGSKEALFQAAFDEDVANMLAVIRDRLSHGTLAGKTPAEPNFIPGLVAAIEHHPLVRRVFRGLEPDRTPELLHTPAVVALRAEVVATVRAGQDRGVLRRDLDATALAGALESLVLALVLGAVQTGRIADDVSRAGLLAIVAQGVAARD
jgi:AcrR family transcriptional regulator